MSILDELRDWPLRQAAGLRWLADYGLSLGGGGAMPEREAAPAVCPLRRLLPAQRLQPALARARGAHARRRP